MKEEISDAWEQIQQWARENPGYEPPSDFACADCWHDTKNNEYYMVSHDLWVKHGAGKGMLCIGCLERRMGRRLVASDFENFMLNVLPIQRSERLVSRLHDAEPETTGTSALASAYGVCLPNSRVDGK